MSLDDIDLKLLRAWARLSASEKRLRFAQRRRLQPVLRHPPRDWCIALRASDTRLEQHASELCSVIPDELPPTERELYRVKHRGRSGQRIIHRTTPLEDSPGDYLPERLILSAAAIRALTQPVWISEPTRILDAARLLGVTDSPLRRWVKHGTLKCKHFPSPSDAGGPPRVFVWTSGPIDPNHYHGLPPDPIWGNAWQYFANRFPPDFEAAFVRVPLVRTVRGRPRHMGWTWVCPGRLMRDPQHPNQFRHTGCGRTCRTLFGPVPVFTLADYLDRGQDVEREPASPDDALNHAPHPSDFRSPLQHVPLSFACEHCWKPQHLPRWDPHAAWNLFVTHISGGLLHGSDVSKPPTACLGHPRRSKNPPLTHMPRPNLGPMPWHNKTLPPYLRVPIRPTYKKPRKPKPPPDRPPLPPDPASGISTPEIPTHKPRTA